MMDRGPQSSAENVREHFIAQARITFTYSYRTFYAKYRERKIYFCSEKYYRGHQQAMYNSASLFGLTGAVAESGRVQHRMRWRIREMHLSSLSETHLGVVLTTRYQTTIGCNPET